MYIKRTVKTVTMRVFIVYKLNLTAQEVKVLLIPDCGELIWEEIIPQGDKKLYIASYFRPSLERGASLEQSDISLSRLDKTTSTI